MDTRTEYAMAEAYHENARRPLVKKALEQGLYLLEVAALPAWWPALAPLTRAEREKVREALTNPDVVGKGE